MMCLSLFQACTSLRSLHLRLNSTCYDHSQARTHNCADCFVDEIPCALIAPSSHTQVLMVSWVRFRVPWPLPGLCTPCTKAEMSLPRRNGLTGKGDRCLVSQVNVPVPGRHPGDARRLATSRKAGNLYSCTYLENCFAALACPLSRDVLFMFRVWPNLNVWAFFLTNLLILLPLVHAHCYGIVLSVLSLHRILSQGQVLRKPNDLS